jgi:ATP-dependent HslUV protease ATP-binding subunit HslU
MMLMEEDNLTPKQIVQELDHYIIGQADAKRAVAIALRNRIRRMKLPPEMQEEVIPKNIIMIGPTGVGKTEISRRLAKIANAPFLKVEATRYTEVGYVGRDVESIIRDLMEIGINMVKSEKMEMIRPQAEKAATDRIIDLMKPSARKNRRYNNRPTYREFQEISQVDWKKQEEERWTRIREKLRQQLEMGELDDNYIELEIREANTPMTEIFGMVGFDETMGKDFKEMVGQFIPPKSKEKKMKISEARRLLLLEEMEKLIDRESVTQEAIQRVENKGIVFLDELDKVAGRETGFTGPDVSREGVQRDLLPIVEGTTVTTKYGMVRTSHILFIAAGAFNVSKPSDLIPELQGRFPIRVELSSLTKDDFVKILTQPQNALIKQYTALLGTEGVELEFTPDAIDTIAELAQKVNQSMENIGARRLHTLLEKLLEDISFHSPYTESKKITITGDLVREKLSPLVKDEDLSKYIL